MQRSIYICSRHRFSITRWLTIPKLSCATAAHRSPLRGSTLRSWLMPLDAITAHCRYLRCMGEVSDEPTRTEEEKVGGFVRNYLTSDGVFLLRLIQVSILYHYITPVQPKTHPTAIQRARPLLNLIERSSGTACRGIYVASCTCLPFLISARTLNGFKLLTSNYLLVVRPVPCLHFYYLGHVF